MLHGNLGLSHRDICRLHFTFEFEPAWVIEFVVTILSYRWCSQIAATWKDQVSVDKQPYGTLHGR